MPYLFDGNNLLGSWGGPRDGDDRRGEVVRRLLAFCRAKGVRGTVVFDGHPLRDDMAAQDLVGSSRVDLQACKLEYSIVSPK